MSQNYLKLQMEANRHMAMQLTRSLRDIHNVQMEMIENVKLGGRHILNYGSCLVPDDYYQKACADMGRSDLRLIKSVYEIYKRENVILDMLEIYFRKVITILGEQKCKNLDSRLQQLLGFATNYASTKVSKDSLSLTLAFLVFNSADFKKNHIKLVRSFSSIFVSVTSFISKAEIALLAVHKLQIQDYTYYKELYQERVEMLYYLIEPSMTKIIYQIKSGDNNEEKIADALYEVLTRE